MSIDHNTNHNLSLAEDFWFYHVNDMRSPMFNLIDPNEIFSLDLVPELPTMVEPSCRPGDENRMPYSSDIKPTTSSTIIECPHQLNNEKKSQIQEELRLHQIKREERRGQMMMSMQRDASDYVSKITTRKASGKKMTGRERQLELERQEREQMDLKNHYKSLIDRLESKCNKMREILENLVASSPDYSNQMSNVLESTDIFYETIGNSRTSTRL